MRQKRAAPVGRAARMEARLPSSVQQSLIKVSLAAFAAIATAIGAVGSAAAQAPAPAGVVDGRDGPALWRIADEDSAVWMFGSVHALAPGVDWRRPALDLAFDRAEVVYFEAQTSLLSTPSVIWFVMQNGYQAAGSRLSDDFDAETWRGLTALAAEAGIAQGELDGLRPWLALLAISSFVSLQEGAQVALGVDAVLEVDALRAGLEVRYLETAVEQLGYFADVPEADQIAALRSLPAMAAEYDGMGDDLVDSWRDGRLDALGALLDESFESGPESFREFLLVVRNKNWIPIIEAALAENVEVLVVAGAGHFVGADSVIELLEARGHRVERY